MVNVSRNHSVAYHVGDVDMVKSVLGVSHQGLRDWTIQRVSAIIMLLYTVSLFLFLLCHPNLRFNQWHNLFQSSWMKVASLLFVASILYHAWIGMWTIFTDYVKPPILRVIIDFFVVILLFAAFIWALLIVGSV